MNNSKYSKGVHNGALFYVKLGLPVIPICSPKHEGMTEQHKKKCSASGKAPILTGWPNHTQTNEDDVRGWLEKNPKINIGVPLGQTSGMVGIDVDGEVGERLLKELSKGDLPLTWEFLTGKGRRLLYALPEGLSTKKFKHKEKEKGQELAIICEGQQTVLPPSVHSSGKQYLWVENKGPLDLVIAPAPKWILDKITQESAASGLWSKDDGSTPMSPPVTDKDYMESVTEGNRSDKLTKLAGSMLGRGIPEAEVLSFLMNWNKDHCIPPIEEEAIEKMVKHIAVSEQMKGVKRKRLGTKQTQPVFRPTPFINLFLTTQKDMGYSWKYSADMGSFYRCDDSTGPWQRVEFAFVQSVLRRLLIDEARGGKRTWDNIKCVNESIEALKALLTQPDDQGMFDLGSTASMYTLEKDELNPYNHVCVENGILDWRSLKLRSWTSNFITTTQLPVEWDEHADCPNWKRVLTEWIPDKGTIAFLQEYIGLCLIPDTAFRTAVFLFGSGANGKSLFLDGTRLLFGSALVSIPLHRITTRFETVYLQNKLVNICGDIDTKYIKDTGVLKALITGDTLRGEYKHGKSFDFVPVCRLMFSANTLPQVSDKSAAWYSRWKLIEFPHTFPVNAAYKIDLMHKLYREKNGILRWAMEGLQRLKEENKWTPSDTMLQSEEEYRLESDNVAAFLYNVIDVVPHLGKETVLSTQALHGLYSHWIEDNMAGSMPVGRNEFGKRTKTLGYERSNRKIEGKWHSCLVGVKLKEEVQTVYNFFLKARKARV